MVLKIDPEQLTKGMLCILRPRYIPCVFLKALSEGEKGESLVISFKYVHLVLTKNIVMLKAPVLQPH